MQVNKLQELQDHARSRLGNLETWLRRLIHNELSRAYGHDYLRAKKPDGSSLLKSETVNSAFCRFQNNPNRYPRPVDALLLDDAIYIVCRQDLWFAHFKPALTEAFHANNSTTQRLLKRLVPIRNNLSHVNHTSDHDIARVTCYSEDVVRSIQNFFRSTLTTMEFEAPTFVCARDSKGHEWHFNTNSPSNVNEGKEIDVLYPGETLRLELEVDSAFSDSDYEVTYYVPRLLDANSGKNTYEETKSRILEIPILTQHVGERFMIQAKVRAPGKGWFRQMGHDDWKVFFYKVLPTK